MNERVKELKQQAIDYAWSLRNEGDSASLDNLFQEKFAELIVEAVLDQVKERAYYTGDRDWSDEVDRPWIQLEFGYGPLAEMKK